MPNSYFQFKQFRIHQDQCAMKVSTDACILGAYVARHCTAQANHILDIGTGTGLLALMLAQASKARITALEIDESAYLQAKQNFYQSPWADRLHLSHQSLQAFTTSFTDTYDLIICNPPFFINSMKSPDKAKNTARHTDTLSYQDLLSCSHSLASDNALFVVLLPVLEAAVFKRLLSSSSFIFQIVHELLVQDNPQQMPHRLIITLRKGKETTNTDTHNTLLIKDIHGKYTPAFIELLKEYYLYL
jgi:tRNA1Val (adenine37-N6)-methyltransferase